MNLCCIKCLMFKKCINNKVKYEVDGKKKKKKKKKILVLLTAVLKSLQLLMRNLMIC